MTEIVARIGRGVLICLLPVLMALDVAASTFPGGTTIPWHPVMVDLDVYRLAGQVLLDGGNFYQLPGALQFLYPRSRRCWPCRSRCCPPGWSRSAGRSPGR